MSGFPGRWPRSEHALVAAGVFLLAWGLVHVGPWSHGQIVDTGTYRVYGDAIVHLSGRGSRHDLPDDCQGVA